MRAVVQRVRAASVTVSGQCHARIGHGFLVYLGVAVEDTLDDAGQLACRVRHLRVFDDQKGLLNRDVVETGGQVLVVPAFTVMGDARKGRRPSFAAAGDPERASLLYEKFCAELSAAGVDVARGRFRASMQVESVNDGPVCLLLDSTKRF